MAKRELNFYRLTAKVQEASGEESEEILAEIDAMSDDDLTIASVKHFSVRQNTLRRLPSGICNNQ
jgi:hypothetical protein